MLDNKTWHIVYYFFINLLDSKCTDFLRASKTDLSFCIQLLQSAFNCRPSCSLWQVDVRRRIINAAVKWRESVWSHISSMFPQTVKPFSVSLPLISLLCSFKLGCWCLSGISCISYSIFLCQSANHRLRCAWLHKQFSPHSSAEPWAVQFKYCTWGNLYLHIRAPLAPLQ